jgi:hypothetical protein
MEALQRRVSGRLLPSGSQAPYGDLVGEKRKGEEEEETGKTW